MSGINDVRWYDGDMTGIPAGATRIGASASNASQILTILDACLVNGFNLQSVVSIVVTSGVALVTTTAADHNFRDYTVIRIAGATPAELNGDWKMTTAGGNSFSFPTSVADGTATGTISVKTAPLGWSKPFNGTNIGVYQASSGLKHFFRVSDPAGSFANLRGFRVMSDVNNGTEPFPTATQNSIGISLTKYIGGGVSGGKWRLYGDDRICYLIFDANENNGGISNFGPVMLVIGEVASFSSNDVSNSVLVGIGANTIYPTTIFQNSGFRYVGNNSSYAWNGNYLAGSASNETQAPTSFRFLGHSMSDAWGFSSTFRVPYPNPTDSALFLHHPILLQEGTGYAVRGTMPGLYQPLQNAVETQKNSIHIVNNRQIYLASIGGTTADSQTSSGLIGFDITGPWR